MKLVRLSILFSNLTIDVSCLGQLPIFQHAGGQRNMNDKQRTRGQ